VLREYSRTKADSLAQIRATVTELQHFFLRDCFLLAHPVQSMWTFQHRKTSSSRLQETE